MKVVYENDLAKGPGNGLFRCSEAALGAGDYTFSLARASDHQFLGAEDWGTQRVNLHPVTQTLDGGSLTLCIDSDVVNALDVQENYRFFLNGPDGSSLSAGLQVREVIYHTGNRTAAVAQPEPAAPAAPPAPPEVPEPEPSEMEPLRLPEKPLAETPKAKSRLPLLIALLLLLAAAGGTFLFLNMQEKAEQEQAAQAAQEAQKAAELKKQEEHLAEQKKQQAEQAEKEKAEAEKAQKEKAEAEKAEKARQEKEQAEQQAAQHKTLSAGEQVAQFFSAKDRTPAQAATLSQTLPKASKEEQNAVYRLYYFASENGDTSVLLEYAACLDPALPPWGDLEKDAPAAWHLYEKAKAGRPEAASAQQNLNAWLEKETAAGNAQAREWQSALR